MKIVKSLEDFGLLLKRVSETIQNKVKEKKGRFLSILLSTLGANLAEIYQQVRKETEKEKELLELVTDLKSL